MKKETYWRGTYTLIMWVVLAIFCIGVLVVFAQWRGQRLLEVIAQEIKQESESRERYNIFWDGDFSLLEEDNVVVFDVRYSGADNEILLSLTENLEALIADMDMQPIFLGAETKAEHRGELLTSPRMDLYIGISVGKDSQNPELFGTKCFYNEDYFIPYYNSVWLSDRVMQNVVTEISGKALGIEVCEEKDILNGLSIPATLLQIGYQTNPEEGALLQENGYLKQIATGIVKTVEEYYESQ